MKTILLLALLSLVNINAQECVSFEGVKNRAVVKPIMLQLNKIGINSKIDSSTCRYKIYLPIDVHVESVSDNREIEVHLRVQKDDSFIEEHLLQISDTKRKLYDFTKSNKNVTKSVIKEHSSIIAKTIKNLLF
ncbi:MAG: hypothetical protein U9N42_09500 [Campylobacterota bacterium]|nr:hypothetical protein [Campylobacterota bacterium]